MDIYYLSLKNNENILDGLLNGFGCEKLGG